MISPRAIFSKREQGLDLPGKDVVLIQNGSSGGHSSPLYGGMGVVAVRGSCRFPLTVHARADLGIAANLADLSGKTGIATAQSGAVAREAF